MPERCLWWKGKTKWPGATCVYMWVHTCALWVVPCNDPSARPRCKQTVNTWLIENNIITAAIVCNGYYYTALFSLFCNNLITGPLRALSGDCGGLHQQLWYKMSEEGGIGIRMIQLLDFLELRDWISFSFQLPDHISDKCPLQARACSYKLYGCTYVVSFLVARGIFG